jgi:1,4-dihydroxy-2-naphthoyl-CoA synthase
MSVTQIDEYNAKEALLLGLLRDVVDQYDLEAHSEKFAAEEFEELMERVRHILDAEDREFNLLDWEED